MSEYFVIWETRGLDGFAVSGGPAPRGHMRTTAATEEEAVKAVIAEKGLAADLENTSFWIVKTSDLMRYKAVAEVLVRHA